MSVEQKKIRWSYLPIKAGGVIVIMASFLVLGLTGCNGCSSKPHENVFLQNNISNDVVTIFFSKYQGNQSIVEDVVRKLPENAKKTPLRFALTELLKGPTQEEKSEGFYTEIPQGTRLLDVQTQGNTVAVNLSKHFTSGGGSTSMNQRF
jgi:spore germination protein GerM